MSSRFNSSFFSFVALALAGGCASVPTGPDVMALPGAGRNFEEFRRDDLACRDFAFQQIGGNSRERSANTAVLSNAAIGVAVGAVAGAAIAGRDGAGVGAGTGLLIGGMSGGESAQYASRGGQRQYDHAYVQCMYAKGHRVPLNGVYTNPPTTSGNAATTSSASSIPPPPPGMPPPPPPTR